jgi:hypothetical protein
MKHTTLLALIAGAAVFGSSAYAATATPTPTPKPNTISFTTFPSDTPYTTSKLPVAATATAGTPTIAVSGPATYASGLITLTGSGTITVTASEATAPAGYVKPTAVTQKFVVSALPNSISFSTTLSDTPYTSNPIALTASSTAGTPRITVTSGLAKYTNGAVVLTGVGSVTVTASQTNAPAGYAIPSSVSQTFIVSALNNTITFSTTLSDTPYTTNAIPLTASSTAGTPKITIVSGNAKYTNGAIKLTGLGPVTVSASQTNAPTGYSIPTAIQQTFTVTPLTNTISFTTFPANPTSYTTNGLAVAATATAGTPTISVTGAGSYNSTTKKIILSGAGDVIVTASVTNTPTGYAPATPLQQTFTVAAASNTIAAFATTYTTNWSTNPPVITVAVPKASSGLPVTLSVVSGPGTVTATNKVRATGAGLITIAANQAGNANYVAATQVTTTINVNKGSNSLTAFGATAPTTVNYGTNSGVFTIAVPKGKSSATVGVTATGATVSISGTTATVTPTGAGTVGLTASQAGDDNWTSATDVTKNVTVAKATTVITAAQNQTTTFSATVAPVTVTPTSPSKGAFAYPSTATPTTAGKVDSVTGVVTITGAGSIVVKATQAGDPNYTAVTTPVNVCTITVSKGTQTLNTPPNVPVPASGTSVNIPLGQTSDQGIALTYTVSGPAGYVPLTGKVTPTGNGTIGITATTGTNANYNPLASTPVVTFTATKIGSTSTYNFSKQ